MSRPFVAQWGILGSGWISSEFVRDICRPLSSRDVTDVSHAVGAVAARSLSKAQEFVDSFCPKGAAAQIDGLVDFAPKAYGDYKEMIADRNVNIVYVGTVHTFHYEHAKLVLDAGKNCLLEKPATLNAAEWKSLMGIAKEKKVFLMEAVWTRFNPTLLAIQKAVHVDNVIGDVRCVYSDQSGNSLGHVSDEHRALNPKLAGGCLLDVGPYPMCWSLSVLFRHPKNDKTPPEKVGSTMLKYRTGVDCATSFAMTFPKIGAMAYCSTNFFSFTDKRHTRIVGSTGEILVESRYTSRPQRFVIRRYADRSSGQRYLPDEVVDHSFDAFGLCWEADAVARCLKDGLLESPNLPHDESLMVMEIFDKIRKEGGYEYLPGLEKVKLP